MDFVSDSLYSGRRFHVLNIGRFRDDRLNENWSTSLKVAAPMATGL